MKTSGKILVRLSIVAAVVLSFIVFTACSLQNPDNNGSTTVQNSTTQTRAFAGMTEALTFFHANYCGSGQTVSWRSNCHMGDNPTGGYHDAGDHVKFNLPAAFMASMLCWADYEYGGFSADAEISRALSYLSACWNGSTYIYQVGDGGTDHAYWGSPELQTGARPSYSTTQASAAMAQAAAAFALASITGHTGGNINTAKSLFTAADNAKSDAGYAAAANGYYTSGGFYDDLMWAAVWLYIATSDSSYLTKAEGYYSNLNADIIWTHCWDDSRYGAILKLAQLTGKSVYINRVETNLDWWQKGTSGGITYTPGGLPYLNNWGCLRYASAEAFLAKIWADYTSLGTASKKAGYKTFANNVLNYIEGSNPQSECYIIGVGSKYPQCPHHRAANPGKTCPSLHVLTGAMPGGPDSGDNFVDDPNQYQYTEPAIDYNACLVAALAAANGTLKSHNYSSASSSSTASSQASVASSAAVSSSRSSVASSAAVSSSRSSVASSAAASSTAASSGGYAVNYTVNNDWGAGATCTVTIKNNSATAVNGWTLVWTFAGNQTLTQIWNATYTASGATITVKNASFNNIIGASGGTQSFGFNLSYSGSNAKPASFTLNGTACTTY